MPRQRSDDTFTRDFLRMAAFWFNDRFEYQNVSKWCHIPEKKGRVILEKLIDRGLVEVDSDGATKLTIRGQSETRRAA